MAASPSSPSNSSTSRRPSELNAAADLVGLGGTNKDEKEKGKDVEEPKANVDSKKEDATETKEGGKPTNKAVEAGSTAVLSDKTSTNNNGQVTALSVLNDELNSATEEGPLKPKTKSELDEQAGGGEADKTSFPLLLHNVVTDPATDDCIHWLTCGTRFIISDKKKFATDVLPRFYGPAKFTSFTRRLKRWSFARVPSGPFMGAYYNPNFQRGKPEMAHRVRYNHPSPLSGANLAMQQQKLAGVKHAGGVPLPGMVGNVAAMTEAERAEFFRQMSNNPMMGMMGMQYGMMMNPNMMMMGGMVAPPPPPPAAGGYGKVEEKSVTDDGDGSDNGNNAGMSNGAAAPGPSPNAGGQNPALAMFMEQQERQRMAFQQQMNAQQQKMNMNAAGNNMNFNQGSNNPEPMHIPAAPAGPGPNGTPNKQGGNFTSILAQYVTGGSNTNNNTTTEESTEI